MKTVLDNRNRDKAEEVRLAAANADPNEGKKGATPVVATPATTTPATQTPVTTPVNPVADPPATPANPDDPENDEGNTQDDKDVTNDDDDPENRDPEETPPATVTPPVVTTPPATPPQDEHDRYVASQREAQVLASRNRKVAEAHETARNLPAPTDDELKAAYPEADFSTLAPWQVALMRDNLQSKKRYEIIDAAMADAKKIGEWADKVEAFLTDNLDKQVYPALIGREEAFKEFTRKKSRVHGDMDDLVKAFLFENNSPVVPVTPKKSLLESGGGGTTVATTDEQTADDVATLRKKNPREYQRKLKAGQIKVKVD